MQTEIRDLLIEIRNLLKQLVAQGKPQAQATTAPPPGGGGPGGDE